MRMVMVESVMVLANLHFSFRLCGNPANVNSALHPGNRQSHRRNHG